LYYKRKGNVKISAKRSQEYWSFRATPRKLIQIYNGIRRSLEFLPKAQVKDRSFEATKMLGVSVEKVKCIT
jgi:hypothetical protein